MRLAVPVLAAFLAVSCNAPQGDEGADGDGDSSAVTEPAEPVGEVAAPEGDVDGEAETPAEPAEAETTDASKPLALALALGSDGLRFVIRKNGSTRPVAFGSARSQVETATGNALNAKPIRSENDECPAGPIAFTDYGDLSLLFQDDKFVGWSLNGGKLTSMDGIGIGSTRAEIAETRTVEEQEDSTLGTELIIGDGDAPLVAIMSGPGKNARVTDLWAGMSCVFR